jgi:hypothetical protein
MPTVKNVQRQIRRREGFDVRFLHEGPGPTVGRDVRDDRDGIPGYSYARASPDCTVAVWIDRRFKASFPGFEVQVLWADGKVADHRTLLSSIRATYP